MRRIVTQVITMLGLITLAVLAAILIILAVFFDVVIAVVNKPLWSAAGLCDRGSKILRRWFAKA